MAVPEQTPYIEHTGNGVTTSFSLGFQCESKDHLIVLVDEIEPPIATWSLTGGNVVFTTAPAAGKKITLQRNTPFNRNAEYQSFNNSFRPQTVNIDFDRIWWKLQELGVADWLMKLYVDRLHQQQEQKINDLKGYVDDRDDELRAYLMEEIRKQGVALDQLDEYYNYLMQRLAQIAVDKGWDASFVVDGDKTQKQINDNARINNVKNWGAVGTTGLVSDWYTVGSANYRKYKDLAAVNVDYPFVVDGTESIDYAGFQAAVNFAISNGSNRIFIPFDNAEKYFINRTVTIPASGFVIDGNRSPSYQIRERGGYIYAPASVSDIFDYGCGGIQPSNQLIVNGVGAVGVATPHQSQNFIKHYNNNDGPHRGVLFTRTTAVRFQHVLYIKSDVPSYISAGTVIFETGCVFTHNKNTAYAENRVFGFAMNSIQSEQGARVAGKFDGGVSFRDNMLEGQSNPITIDSNQPSLIVENNYFEAISGDYITAFRGTNINALFDERPNFISTVYSTDIHRINGIARLHAPYRYILRTDRHSLYSFIGANLALGSEFDGAGYIGTGGISTSGLYGFCNPSKLLPARPSAVTNKFVGSDTLETPFGKTYTGLKVVGTSPFNTLNKSWEIGDAVTAVALVKLKEGQAPNFSFYNSDGSLFAQVSQNTVSKMVQGWHVVVISGVATKASTTGRWRFTSDTEIEVAAVGVDVTPSADFKTFNSVQRAEIQVFNPLPLNAETHTYRDVRNLTIPAIAAGAEYKTASIFVSGVAIGDAVVCTPNVDMQGLDWFVRVSAANTIELRIVNRTSASVTLGTVQWNTRVFK